MEHPAADQSRDAFTALVGDLPDTTMPALFDEHGLPVAGMGEEHWASVLRGIEAHLDEQGWDQPAILYALASPAATEAMSGVQPVHWSGPGPDGDEVVTTALAVVPLIRHVPHPVHDLFGFTAPPWAAAVILTFEGWVVRGPAGPGGVRGPAVLPPGMSPSQHPDREEVRSVLMVTRGGTRVSVERIRGEDSVAPLEENATQEGMLVDVLRRTVGVAVPDRGHTVPDYLGRLLVHRLVSSLQQLLEEDPATAPPQVRDELVELRAEVADNVVARHEILGSLVAAQLVPTAAAITHLVSGKGKRRIDRAYGKTLAELATGKRRASEEDTVTVVTCAAAVAGTSWEELAATRAARPLLPPIAEHHRWAGPQLVASWACERTLPGQAPLLDELRLLAGRDCADAVQSLLNAAGWTPAPGTAPQPEA